MRWGCLSEPGSIHTAQIKGRLGIIVWLCGMVLSLQGSQGRLQRGMQAHGILDTLRILHCSSSWSRFLLMQEVFWQ